MYQSIPDQIIREALLKLARRAFAEHLLQYGHATVDDAREAIEIPPGISPNFLSAVPDPFVKAGIIRQQGYVPSERPEAHARMIALWALRDQGGALRWLRDNPAETLEEIRNRPTQHSLF